MHVPGKFRKIHKDLLEAKIKWEEGELIGLGRCHSRKDRKMKYVYTQQRTWRAVGLGQTCAYELVKTKLSPSLVVALSVRFGYGALAPS